MVDRSVFAQRPNVLALFPWRHSSSGPSSEEETAAVECENLAGYREVSIPSLAAAPGHCFCACARAYAGCDSGTPALARRSRDAGSRVRISFCPQSGELSRRACAVFLDSAPAFVRSRMSARAA
ncbi:unnamed protein product [Prorocentrum cordatum]|uniref:Uncharacterized protein n=1 Tax=Prorocentrum cordatum TaxID=2364126 RepID=A0ABN9SLV5_9DINO|nr:unnamed protein product [Polarella glacialis]